MPVLHTDDYLLTLKVVSESCVTRATSVPILVFLGLSVLDLGPMYATDIRQTDVRQHHRLAGHNKSHHEGDVAVIKVLRNNRAANE